MQEGHTCLLQRASRGIKITASALVTEARPVERQLPQSAGSAPTDFEYDAVIIGSGIGGLTTATQLAAKGARVVVLEKCAHCQLQTSQLLCH